MSKRAPCPCIVEELFIYDLFRPAFDLIHFTQNQLSKATRALLRAIRMICNTWLIIRVVSVSQYHSDIASHAHKHQPNWFIREPKKFSLRFQIKFSLIFSCCPNNSFHEEILEVGTERLSDFDIEIQWPEKYAPKSPSLLIHARRKEAIFTSNLNKQKSKEKKLNEYKGPGRFLKLPRSMTTSFRGTFRVNHVQITVLI